MVQRFICGLYIVLLAACAPLSVYAQWVRASGPVGASVLDLQGSETNLIAHVDGGGLYRSTDRGEHWLPINFDKGDNDMIGLVAICDDNLFVSTYSSQSMFRSTDYGEHWDSVGTELPGTSVMSFAVIGTNIFAAKSNHGVFRSSDNGTHWTEVNTGLTNHSVTTLATSGSDIYAGIDNGNHLTFRTRDSGANWIAVRSGLEWRNPFAVAAIGSTTFAGTLQGVYRSTDDGVTWTQSGMANTRIMDLAVYDGYLYAATGGTGIYRTSNGGSSWAYANSGLGNRNVTSLVPIGKDLFAGTGDGIYRITGTGTVWTPVHKDLNANVITALVANGDDLFAGTAGGHVYRTRDNGAIWAVDSGGLVTPYQINDLIVSNGYLFAATINGGVFRSSDNGAYWLAAGEELAQIDSYASALAVSDGWIFAMAGGDLFRSSDNGQHWENSSTGLPGQSVNDIVASHSDLYAVSYFNGVYRSTDNGTSWKRPGITRFDQGISTLEPCGRYLLAGSRFSNGGVYRSSDSGVNWTISNTSAVFAGGTISDIVCNGPHCFAATWGEGVFYSSDSGATWVSISNGLSKSIPYSLAVTGTHLVVGTEGDGVWFRSLADITAAVEPESSRQSTPDALSITPNPVTSVGTVSYQLERRGVVSVSIYDPLGRVVSQPLIEEVQDSGVHQVVLLTDEFAPGVYLCSVSFGDSEHVTRFVVVR